MLFDPTRISSKTIHVIDKINFDDITKKNIENDMPNWSYIPNNPCRMFVIASSRSEKTNYLLNLTHQQLDTNKTHPHAKDFYE